MDVTRHRVLFNGDWGALFWAPNIWQPEGGPYSAKAVHRFTQLLSDSGVDTFAISPNTQIAWYPSKVVPTALDGYSRGDPRWANWFRAHPPETNIGMMDRYLDLARFCPRGTALPPATTLLEAFHVLRNHHPVVSRTCPHVPFGLEPVGVVERATHNHTGAWSTLRSPHEGCFAPITKSQPKPMIALVRAMFIRGNTVVSGLP